MQDCVHCGQQFQPVRKGHSFCSDACRRAARGGTYRKNRELALRRDGYICTECGSDGHLECHHIIWLSKGGDHKVSNLKTLCRKCHKEVHRRPYAGIGTTTRRAGESEVYRAAA